MQPLLKMFFAVLFRTVKEVLATNKSFLMPRSEYLHSHKINANTLQRKIKQCHLNNAYSKSGIKLAIVLM